MDEIIDVPDAELVHFDGPWNASERKHLTAIIQQVERALHLRIPDEMPFGAPWLAAVTDLASSGRRFTAHRQLHSQVLSAASLSELAQQIQALPPNGR